MTLRRWRSLLRSSARPLAWSTLVLGLVAVFALPASAGLAPASGDDSPTRGSHPLRQAFVDTIGRPFDLPDVDAVVRLRCAPPTSDRVAPAVACEWTAGEDVDVRAWQLWKLRLRPASDGRTLVVQVGQDVTSHLDTEVSAPASYLYAVLGLDSDGEVVARSRLEYVKLPPRTHEVDPMRLECAPHRTDTEAAIGCHWSEVRHDAAAGYVIWKQVDGGERMVLGRVGLDASSLRDGEVAPGHRYTYVATAVDADGHVVARSRAVTVGIPKDRPVDPPVDRPVDPTVDRPVDRPADRPVDQPVDRPEARPADRPVDRVHDERPSRD